VWGIISTTIYERERSRLFPVGDVPFPLRLGTESARASSAMQSSSATPSASACVILFTTQQHPLTMAAVYKPTEAIALLRPVFRHPRMQTGKQLHRSFSAAPVAHATHTSTSTSSPPPPPGPSRRQVTVTNDTGSVRWGELSVGEKVARTTQQSFNFGVVIVGVVMTVLLSLLHMFEFSIANDKTGRCWILPLLRRLLPGLQNRTLQPRNNPRARVSRMPRCPGRRQSNISAWGSQLVALGTEPIHQFDVGDGQMGY
jgi:hypothetical protein